ncbi:MAG TPA: NYN domain-containing protein [Anaerolineae bacterium]
MNMTMRAANALCRIGVFYDGAFFANAQRYYDHERDLGWLRFQPFHAFIEAFIAQKEQGHASYKVVYAVWHQGIFTGRKDTPEQLRSDRNLYNDLMRAGVETKYLPMSERLGERGTDVALAVDALQVGLDGKIDIAVLVTGDGDFVPLVRALNQQGVRVLGVYFGFQAKDGKKSFMNERLLSVVNYAVDINSLDNDKESKLAFKSLFRKSTDGD